MAYCLGTLIEILKHILYPDQYHQNVILDHDTKPQIESLFKNACFLRESLANSVPEFIHDRIESLEDRIRGASENAEDILESHITSQIMSCSDGQSVTISSSGLEEVFAVFESAKEEMMQINEHDAFRRMDNKSPAVSSRRIPDVKNTVVGVEEDLQSLRDRLNRESDNLEIIPIVGMGGMGKTTLARILYGEYSSSKSHFDICAWATVSQDYDEQGILLSLLSCITGKPTKEMNEQEGSGLILHKKLFHRRYLIVLDDIWSSKAWAEVQTFFPDDKRGSRIILTTRENEVANYVISTSHVMRLLSKDDSWDLLSKTVFGDEPCPQELENNGKSIANNCRGLPLAIEVIGGILSHADISKDFWMQVSCNSSSFMENADDQLSGVFSLSFAHLPHYLKPCFLYMGAFPEDYKIPASKLIKLWVSEGFLYPIGERILEDVANVYLKALLDRNLIFVRDIKGNREVKSYGMHDLLRDQCVQKAREQNFLKVINLRISDVQDVQDVPSCTRRVNVHSLFLRNVALDTVEQMPLARSFICTGSAEHLSPMIFTLLLLRVLDVIEVEFRDFPEQILKLLNLRYLGLSIERKLSENIAILRNLYVLIVKVQQPLWRFPLNIFDLPQLRHIKLLGMQHPSLLQASSSYDPQENLHTLSTIPISTLTQFLGKFPNLIKLVTCGKTSTDIVDLTCFNKLETLECAHITINNSKPCLSKFIFPRSLKKLILDGCTVPQTCMNTIGELSNLEILKLQFCTLDSSTWEISEDDFCKLQYLKLMGLDIVDWLVDETHFPELRHLAIYYCEDLKEIPSEIGGIDTLEIIEVDDDNLSVLKSAKRIIDEQCRLGNNLLQLRISSE